MLLDKFQVFKKPESAFTATKVAKKNPAVDFRFGEKIRFEKSLVISILICIFCFIISQRFVNSTTKMEYKAGSVMEYTDIIPSTSQDAQRRPPPERPAIPIEAEIEEMAEDVTIDYQDIGFNDLPGLPSFGGIGRGIGKEEFLNVTVAPRLIKQVMPWIPERDKKRGIRGKLDVSVEVDVDGKVLEVIVLNTTINSQEVIKAVVEASYKCVFIPAKKGLVNVKDRTIITYEVDISK